MNKKLLLVAFILFTMSLLLESCSVERIVLKRNQTKIAKQKLSKIEIHKEINFLVNQIEAITPNPYQFTNKSRIDNLIKEIKENKELSPIDFFEKILTLTGMYNIAHLYLSFPNKTYNNSLEKEGGKFPFKCTMLNDSLTITEKYSSEKNIKKGDKVLSINGKRADSLFKNFYKYIGGINSWKKYKTSNSFHKFLWLNNIKSPYKLQVFNKNTGIKNYIVSGAKKKFKPTINNHKKNEINHSFQNRIFYKRVYDTIAYIDFNQMDVYKNIKDYDVFLNTVFTDIKNKNTKFLIIDVRDNPGGNSLLGEKLVNYINDKPYRMSGGKKWKVTKEYKDNFKKMFPLYLRPFLKTDSTIKKYFNSLDNTFIDSNDEKIIKMPLNNDLRFLGAVYLIINNGTFSSANILANAIEDFNIATIVGEKSGEIVNDYGEIVAVKLKNSGICAWVPSAIFNRANGITNDKNPVIPNVYIKQEILNKMTANEISDYIISLKSKSISN